MTTIGMLLFDGAEELDFVGPWEVFTASAMLQELEGAPADAVMTIAESLDPIKCAKGLRVLPDRTLTDHPLLDVVLVPGGQGTRTEMNNTTILEWLAKVDESTIWTTSVCTGSLVLHQSGVGKDKRMATHWGAEDTLVALGDVEVVRNMRWVVDGKVVSSQGVSAGIDMALWIVGQLHGPAHARKTQHYIQYDPAPPYQAAI